MAGNPPNTIPRGLWSQLSPRQREVLLREIELNEQPISRTPLHLVGAEAVRFEATIIDGEKVVDKSLVGQTLWFEGHNGAKGPRGGVYCYGSCTIGSELRGVLKISQRAFEQLRRGGQTPGWVQFDQGSRHQLVGVLTSYRVSNP